MAHSRSQKQIKKKTKELKKEDDNIIDTNAYKRFMNEIMLQTEYDSHMDEDLKCAANHKYNKIIDGWIKPRLWSRTKSAGLMRHSSGRRRSNITIRSGQMLYRISDSDEIGNEWSYGINDSE